MARIHSEHPVPSAPPPAGTPDIRTLTTSSGPVDIYSSDPGFVVAVTGRYIIQIIKDRGTTTMVSLVRRALADLSTRYEKFGYVGLIEPDAQLLMPPDIRNGFNALVKRYSPHFTGAAIVFEKQGFHATAVRSLVTAVNLASRATHPNHVFSDVREGLSWLSQITPGEPTLSGLLQILQQLRLSLTPRT